MRLVYFARVRETIGVDGEDRMLPVQVTNVGECIDWLASGSETHAAAFADRNRLRFALDQIMVSEGTALEGALELAIFPPVTGG